MSATSLQEGLSLAEHCFGQRNFLGAREILEKVLTQHPNSARANELMGYIAGNLGDIPLAIELLEKAISLNGCARNAFYELGSIYLGREEDKRALDLFQKAIKLGLDTFELHFEYGQVLARQGIFKLAIEQFGQAKNHNDAVPEVFFNLAKLYECTGELNAALASYERVLELDPGFSPAWLGGGEVLRRIGKPAEALNAFDKALAISPNYSEVLFLKANVLRSLKRYKEALDLYSRCLENTPDIPFLLGAYINTKMLICDWADYDANLAKVKEGLLKSQPLIPPFPLLALVDDPCLQLLAAKVWSSHENKTIEISRVPFKKTNRNKIRIGYFSADFGFHPVAFLIAEIFELHNRDQFETYAFSTGPNTGDPMRKRLEKSFDHFWDVVHWSDEQIAAKSRDLEIDIAIDLTGFTQDGRTNIFALGAAPVQVNFLGYPGTLGTSYMDYIVVDPILASEDDEQFYAEKLAYLPNAYQPNDRKRMRAQNRMSRDQAGLPENAFVFCCFNNNFKITPYQLDLWATILKRVNGSVLWLLEDNPVASANLKMEIAKRGVEPDRLLFAPRVSPQNHLHRMTAADLFLDTAPYNAHTTTSDALWIGLPVLTCLGKSFCSRVAASLVSAAGIPEMIAKTNQEYIEQAVRLANHPSELAILRDKLAQVHKNAPLFDSVRFTENLENLYMQMFARLQSGEPPAKIRVFEG
jgi:protein O-GlcNAc transferase